MTKLIIHIGTQKSGTSVIQHFLSENRPALAKLGVNYPLFGRGPRNSAAQHAQHVLAHNWAPGWLTPVLAEGQTEKAWDNFVAAVHAQTSMVHVISSEHFYKAAVMDPSIISKIRKDLEGVDVSIVVYFRRPDSFALSNWAHSVKTIREFKTPFEKYCQSMSLENLLSYKRNLDSWKNGFGDDSVRVRIYDRRSFVNKDIIDDFLNCIDVPRVPEMEPVEDANISLTPFTLDFLNDLDRLKIPRYAQFVEELENFSTKSVPEARSNTLNPMTPTLANTLLDKFGSEFLEVSRDSSQSEIDIDSLRPTESAEVFRPISMLAKKEILDAWVGNKFQSEMLSTALV